MRLVPIIIEVPRETPTTSNPIRWVSVRPTEFLSLSPAHMRVDLQDPQPIDHRGANRSQVSKASRAKKEASLTLAQKQQMADHNKQMVAKGKAEGMGKEEHRQRTAAGKAKGMGKEEHRWRTAAGKARVRANMTEAEKQKAAAHHRDRTR